MSKKEYLDKDGLMYYNEKLKAILGTKANSVDVNREVNRLDTRITTTNTDLSTFRTSTESSITSLNTKDTQHDSQISTLNSVKADKTAVTREIEDAIRGVTQFDYQIVEELPAEGVKGVIYLVLYSQSHEGDVYQEWIWIESEEDYECLGFTNDIDLSNYVTFDDTITNAEIDALFRLPFGIVEYLDGLSTPPTIENDTVSVISQSIVTYYDADPSVGRMVAGNRFGFKITAPNKLTYNDYQNAPIEMTYDYYDGEQTTSETRNYIWADVKDENTWTGFWPLVTSTLVRITIDITWQTDNTQRFIVNIPDDVILEEPSNVGE